MKITKKQLKQIIKEEISKTLREIAMTPAPDRPGQPIPDEFAAMEWFRSLTPKVQASFKVVAGHWLDPEVEDEFNPWITQVYRARHTGRDREHPPPMGDPGSGGEPGTQGWP